LEILNIEGGEIP